MDRPNTSFTPSADRHSMRTRTRPMRGARDTQIHMTAPLLSYVHPVSEKEA